MNIQDKLVVSRWLRSNASLSEVSDLESIGLVGNIRFTKRAKDVYSWLWAWSAPRFEGRAGRQQECIYQKHGMDALNRRYARVNRIIKALKEQE